MSGKRRDSFSGEMVKKHDEHEAERLLNLGLAACGLDRNELGMRKKGDNNKKAIAWLIRKNTSVRNEWISDVLKMGHPSSVSRNMQLVENGKQGELWELKNKMLKFKD